MLVKLPSLMDISSLWQSQPQPLTLTWSHQLKAACPVNMKFILLYKVGRKKNPKPSSTCFMSSMLIHVYIFINRYKMWRLLAPQLTSSPLWWNSFHTCLKCLTSSSSVFKWQYSLDLWVQTTIPDGLEAGTCIYDISASYTLQTS